MEIAILHYAAPPVVGGVESVIACHARLMACSGERVRILAGRGGQVLPGVTFLEVPLLDSLHPDVLKVKAELDQGHVPAGFGILSHQIKKLLQQGLEGVDLLIAHNVASLHKNLPLTSALMDLANAGAIPALILWHHDLAWSTPRYRSELHDGFPWDILSQAWPGVKRHVVVSHLRQRELAQLMGISIDSVQVIPNGVEIKTFLKLEEQTWRIIRELGLLDAAPLLLQPVRITRRKNIELALRVIASLRKRLPDAQVLVTGPLGPHNPTNLEYFEQLIRLRNELNLKGAAHLMAEISPEFLPNQVISDFYRIADGLLLTSQEEGFGIPLLESGLIGLPIFCPDIAPLRELAEDGAEFFALDENPEAISDLICQRLKSNPIYWMRRRVRQEYTWEKIYHQQIEPLLDEFRA